MKEFKIRCSGIGEIMGVKGLGKTGETFLKKWYLEQKYQRKQDFWAKQIEKGLAVEPIGIEMLSKHLGADLFKNDEYFENDFMKGSPDVDHDGIIWDIKSSWDIFSFPWFDKELPNKDYWWQMQGYMALTGHKKAALVYCLIDTPNPLIALELKKLYYQSGGVAEDWTPEANERLAENYRFSDIPEKDRIKIFEIDRDDEAIKLIEQRVLICREFLKASLS